MTTEDKQAEDEQAEDKQIEKLPLHRKKVAKVEQLDRLIGQIGQIGQIGKALAAILICVLLGRVLINSDWFGNRWLPQTTCAGCAAAAQAIFRRRRHQPRRPPLAKIKPGKPAPAMGPGTATSPISGDGFGETTRSKGNTLRDMVIRGA